MFLGQPLVDFGAEKSKLLLLSLVEHSVLTIFFKNRHSELDSGIICGNFFKAHHTFLLRLTCTIFCSEA